MVGQDVTFDHLLNFRDVGQTVNAQLSQTLLATGQLYRSARPDDASDRDRERLNRYYGVKTIVDLRTKSEHVKQARRRGAQTPTSTNLASNHVVAQGLMIPGIVHHEISVNGGDYERALFQKLSLWNRTKMLTLMFAGYRMEAIKIMGREVLQGRGLVGLGCDSIDYSGLEISQVFEILADARNYPILIHCSQGKDRTGLIIALVLFLLEVPLDAIRHDYALSQIDLLPEREERMQEIQEMGLTAEFADAPPDWIDRIHHHIIDRFTSVSAYLLNIGVDTDAQQRVRRHLLYQ